MFRIILFALFGLLLVGCGPAPTEEGDALNEVLAAEWRSERDFPEYVAPPVNITTRVIRHRDVLGLYPDSLEIRWANASERARGIEVLAELDSAGVSTVFIRDTVQVVYTGFRGYQPYGLSLVTIGIGREVNLRVTLTGIAGIDWRSRPAILPAIRIR